MGKDQLDDLELDEQITLRILDGIAWDSTQADWWRWWKTVNFNFKINQENLNYRKKSQFSRVTNIAESHRCDCHPRHLVLKIELQVIPRDNPTNEKQRLADILTPQWRAIQHNQQDLN